MIPLAIVLCFVLGALGWWLAVHREAKAVPGCYEWKFGSQSFELRSFLNTSSQKLVAERSATASGEVRLQST